ncbi:DUF6191 domain-containing protein [Lentzea sp. NPDC051213]|uniref:DUF6191 domain-containing protein n=1 Tax=Lentzea sp. NPDC051213 TaxID=3364126 RepID=UPI0037B26E73
MGVGFLFAMSLPALVVLLIALAFVERFVRGRGSGAPIAAVGFEELGANFEGAKRDELEHRKEERQRRDEEGDGAPPRSRVDLDGGTAVLKLPS